MVALLAGALATCGGGNGDDGGAASPPTSPDGSEAVRMAYVFTFFRGEGGRGVHLAVSTDGLEFREVNDGEAILTSELGEGLTRDPSILLGPDERWHMVWTSGDLRSVGLSSSDDLLTWDEPRTVAVMEHEPTAINSWAPELHWDATAERYSVVWASTVRRVHPSGTSEPAPDGEAFEHRLYVSHSTDLADWTEGELYWDGAINAIDGAVVRDEAAERHVLVYKDERLVPEVRKRVAVATASAFEGPWDEGTVVDELGSWVEGPSLVRDLDDEGWLLYADRYYGETYAAASSPDLRTWTDRAAEVTMPPGARHGTVLRVPYERIEGLLDSAVPVPDPDTTSTTAATPIPDGPRQPVDPSTYDDERPTTGVGGVLFDLLTAQGVEPNRAVCAAEVLLTRTTEAELLASGLVELTDEAVAPVVAAALDCGVTQDQVDATLQAARGG